MVEIQIRIKLAAQKMTDCSKVPEYKKPNASQWQNYNDSFASLFASSPPRNSEFWKSFNGAIRTAARNCLSKETPKGKKCYISQSTWNLIDRRQALHIAGKHDEVVNLDKQIKRNARANRKQHLVNQFQHNPADSHRKQLWKAVNHLKRDYKPSYISMRDSCGRLVPLQDRAETIASYLEQKQWSNTSGQALLPSCRKIGDDPDSNRAPFSMQELNDVLKGCKLGKQPGPDCIIMELYKWLNSANRQTLLNILNDWWAHGDIPTISRQNTAGSTPQLVIQ